MIKQIRHDSICKLQPRSEYINASRIMFQQYKTFWNIAVYISKSKIFKTELFYFSNFISVMQGLNRLAPQ